MTAGRRHFKARERIAWGSPVLCLGIECRAADPAIANGTLLKPRFAGGRRKSNAGERVEVEMIQGLGARDLHAMANGPCLEPRTLYLPDGKISEAELAARTKRQFRDAGIR